MDAAFPKALEGRIATALAGLGSPLARAPELAKAVERLSDFYIAKPDGATPWHEPWAQAAYLAYFLPLNFVRVRRVIEQGMAVGFFHGLSRYTDFGSGAGTVSLALGATLGPALERGTVIERAGVAMRLHRQLMPEAEKLLTFTERPPERGERLEHLSVFSFALTELTELPRFARQSEALMLIEPATHQDSRKLLKLRAELLQDGWFAWAPCTHQRACPLLSQSERDWCHDRVPFEQPVWFEELEEHLPMKNATLAHSYLLMKRTPPPAGIAGLGRLTGDLRKEKGQSRQMVCRGEEREFLSWQKKHGEAPGWGRGGLVRIAEEVEKKSNELRVKAGQCELMTGVVE